MYDDGDEKKSVPLFALREHMDSEDGGQTETMPELPSGEVGYTGVERSEGRSPAKGWVYFIESGDGQFVKIGFSRQVMVRMSQLGTLRPGNFSLNLLGSLPGSIDIEKWIHHRFAEDRDNGEWFRQSERLSAFIASLNLIPPAYLPPRKTKRFKGTFSRQRGLLIEPEPVTEPETLLPEPEILPEGKTVVSRYLAEIGRKGGKAKVPKGIAALSPEERKELGRKAAEKGWAKKRAAKKAGKKK